jgi:2-hydroxy-6-oxonona-2,4-dienedioate hydrolase
MITRFTRDLESARRRILHSGAKVTQTAHGSIEYLEFGDGSPVLLIPGVVEGADHELYLARTYLGEGFRIIAVSRFGYVGSPLPKDSSSAAQADRFAALLDSLGIDEVAVVATSAGTAPALQFGLRHPDRCRAVAIWSQAVPPYKVPPALLRPALRTFFGSDFAFWLLMNYVPRLRMRLIGVPRELHGQVGSSEKRRLIEELVASFLPVSLRVDGILNDMCVTNPDLNTLTLEGLSVPTLIIHAKDDPWGAHEGARQMASSAPKAQFVEFEAGGHLLLDHVEEVRTLIGTFVRQHLHGREASRHRLIGRRPKPVELCKTVSRGCILGGC